MADYVIRSWLAGSEAVDREKNYVVIHGRRSGVIAFLLTVAGFDPTKTIKVNTRRVEIIDNSLFGAKRHFVPLGNVCSLFCGYHRPILGAFSIVGLSLVIGFFMGATFALRNGGMGAVWFILSAGLGIAAAILFLILNKSLTLGFIELSGFTHFIDFKSSVIENQEIDEGKARAVCEIVQRLMDAHARNRATVG